jgi:hypothetical protein
MDARFQVCDGTMAASRVPVWYCTPEYKLGTCTSSLIVLLVNSLVHAGHITHMMVAYRYFVETRNSLLASTSTVCAYIQEAAN